jgi:acetyl-CoA synthetase
VTFAAVRQAFRWEQALGRLDWDATRRVNLGHEACDRWAADRGRLALIWVAARGEARPVTYFELAQLSNRLANVLRRLGVGRGEPVAALMPRMPETFVASLATWKAGAREVEFVANLPRTESGKIQRALLRRRAVEERAAMGREEP